MITVPAIRLQQFGTIFYQAAISAIDASSLVKFEVLSFGDQKKQKRKKKRSKSGVNWQELEKKITGNEKAYQRPILKKKVDDLVNFYRSRYEHMDLAPIPGAIILVSEQRLDFTPSTSRSPMGHLQLPEQDGLFRTLDGQHRLLALAAYAEAEGERADVAESLRTMTIPAIIFENLTAGHSVEMFVTINTKHTRLKKDVIMSLSGRRLYKDEMMASAHDIIRSLNERQDSPLKGDIKILGVGRGKVSQSPLAQEMVNLFASQATASASAAKKFRDNARAFFLTYFKQVANAFPEAWAGRKYSIKRGTSLRAFIRAVPMIMEIARQNGLDPYSGRDLGHLLSAWSSRIGDRRFVTEGEWRLKSAGGGSRTVELLTRELVDALR